MNYDLTENEKLGLFVIGLLTFVGAAMTMMTPFPHYPWWYGMGLFWTFCFVLGWRKGRQRVDAAPSYRYVVVGVLLVLLVGAAQYYILKLSLPLHPIFAFGVFPACAMYLGDARAARLYREDRFYWVQRALGSPAHPGRLVMDLATISGWSISDLAERIGVSERAILADDGLFITPSAAIGLARVFGKKPSWWLKLHEDWKAQYRLPSWSPGDDDTDGPVYDTKTRNLSA